MGNQLVWDDRFNIGVEIIDKEHKKLFKIMNKLFTANEHEKKSGWFCQEGIKYFKDHAIKHFSEEEAYMESIGYQGLEMHKRLHADFRMRTLPSLEKELEKTGYCEEAISHFLGVCAGWLIGHTLTEDHAIAGNEETKWASLLPEEEQEAVKQTILQLLQDMFRLQAQVISECYGGEKFGSGIYYRLIYATQEGSQQEKEDDYAAGNDREIALFLTHSPSPLLLDRSRRSPHRSAGSPRPRTRRRSENTAGP